MRKEVKRKFDHPYLMTSIIILTVFIILFLAKGIYPFGTNSLIWGDMHDQVTAFYYHFYDAFHGDTSLLINFSTSGSINFFGILAYYLLSPISFLILLFPRENIYQAISVLIAFKVLLSGLTSLYFIRAYFKNTPHYISVLLAILYAFCGYNILLYQITAWIDIVYLFPLLLIGLKKLLDLEKPIMYLILMTLCLIFCFYLSGLMLIFIFFTSFMYLYFFRDRDTWKKAILSLGICTILALLLSSFIVLPTLQEISVSSRMGFSLENLLNSKVGPLNDKLCFFATAGFSIVGTILLYWKGWKTKKHRPVLGYILANIVLLLIPVLIEPVNKMWHLGSYAFFPLRLGFILLFFLLIASLCYFTYIAKEKNFPKEKIKWAILITFISVTTCILITCCNFSYLQHKIFGISLGSNIQVVIILLLMTVITAGAIFFILWLHQFHYDKTTFQFIWIIALTNIVCTSFLYFGINFAQESLTGVYEDMQKMEESYQEDDYMRVKDLYPKLVMNNGMVTRYHTLDHFTSLTDKSNMETLKKMGYSSYWVKTYSIGGSLFSDALLANQYLISKDDYQNPYYDYVTNYGEIQFYKQNRSIPYGAFIDHNVEIMNLENAFLVQNAIYQGITGEEEEIFSIYDDNWTIKNLEVEYPTEQNRLTTYEIINPDEIAYLERTISIKEKRNLYLEMLRSIDNATNKEILESVNVYINGKLLLDKYPKEINNGLLDLGIYENEEVVIRIEFNRSIQTEILKIAAMDIAKYENYIQAENTNLTIDYHNNEVEVTVSSNQVQTLFLPIAYNDGYHATVNGKEVEIEKLYDNFIGIPLVEGENHVVISFIPPALSLSAFISIFALGMTIVLFKTRIYQKIISMPWLQNITYSIYLVGYGFLIVAMYIVPIVCFLLSFFIKIKI